MAHKRGHNRSASSETRQGEPSTPHPCPVIPGGGLALLPVRGTRVLRCGRGGQGPIFHRALLPRIFQGTCSAHKTHFLRPPIATTTSMWGHNSHFHISSPYHLATVGRPYWYIPVQARPVRFFPRSLQLRCTEIFWFSLH